MILGACYCSLARCCSPHGILYPSPMPAIKGALSHVVEASREAITLNELAERCLPGLQAAFGCSLGCVTHSPCNGTIEILSTTDAGVLGEYRRDWFAADPLNEAVRRYETSWFVPATHLPEWRSMQKHLLYAEWAPSKHVRFLLHLRLGEARYLEAGAVNVFLCRPKEEPDFGNRELLALSRIAPDLKAAVHRCGRLAAVNSRTPLLESLLDNVESRALLAFRADGRVVWISKAAQRLLPNELGRERSVPALLLDKARLLTTGNLKSAAVCFATEAGVPLTASVQTARAGSGETIVIVNLRSPVGMLPAEFRERFRLTLAEADVLSDLAEGLSNAQIAERRSVSTATVRTHVAHILAKMGVRSRLQAGV